MQKLAHQTRSFDGFTLDLTRGCLLRGDEELKLRPKSFDVLKYLVENSSRLVSKDELIGAVWRDTFVTDNSLVQCLIEIRRALGDEAQHYVKTVPRRGYIFEAQVGENIPALERAVYAEQVEGLKVTIEEEEEIHDRAVSTAHPTASAEYVVSEIKDYKRVAPLALAMLLITVAGIAFGIYKFIGRNRSSVKAAAPFQSIKISRLTNTGRAADAAISPDGKYVIHVVDHSGKQSLWMRQVSTASNVEVASPLDVRYAGLTFSGDGDYLYYSIWDRKNPGPAALYQMPVLGGPSKKLLVDIDSVITFSPDNKRFAFLRGYPPQGESALIVAKADGTGVQKLAVRKLPDSFSAQGDAPAWSPDGKVIACPAGSADAGGPYMTVLEVHVADGTSRPITAQRWWQVGRMSWLRDGNGLIFTAREQESSPSQLWYLSYPGGEVHRITNDLNDYAGVSLTADATALVTVQSDLRSNIWLAPGGDASRATQIPSDNFDGLEGISWTPDGKIVYASRAGGNSDIWIMNQDGTGQKQLTADAGNNSWPSVSPDGLYIAFMSDRAGARHIWRMDRDGDNPRQLTSGGNEWYPDCSPDGLWVAYVNGFGMRRLWKVPINGGKPVQINDKTSARPAISPDGKWIASTYFGDTERIKTAIYPFAGGEPIKILDIWNFYQCWTPDGRALAYVDPRSSSNITSQPIGDGPLRQLTNFKDGQIFRFSWSRDGKQLALARGTSTNDVVLVRVAP